MIKDIESTPLKTIFIYDVVTDIVGGLLLLLVISLKNYIGFAQLALLTTKCYYAVVVIITIYTLIRVAIRIIQLCRKKS